MGGFLFLLLGGILSLWETPEQLSGIEDVNQSSESGVNG